MPELGQRWVEHQTLEFLASKTRRARERLREADDKYGTLLWEICLRFDDEQALVLWLTENDLTLHKWHLKLLVEQWKKRDEP
jgi:hypothetical protein